MNFAHTSNWIFLWHYMALCFKLHICTREKKKSICWSNQPDVWTACSPTRFKLFLLSSSIALLVRQWGGAETKDKWRPALKQDARRSGGEIRREKRWFVYPWWSVDVGGLCSRHIQISLFKIFWYLVLGTGLNANMSGNVQQGTAWFHLQIQSSVFSTLSAASRGEHACEEGNVDSALITVQLR